MKSRTKNEKQQGNHLVSYGTATIGSKGQIVIPAKLRKEMQLNPGDNVMFVRTANVSGAVSLISVNTLLELQQDLAIITGQK